MPNYDFRCQSCGKKFSKRVGYMEKDKVTCDQCGGKAKQIFTGFLYSRSSDSAQGESGSACSKSSCSGCSGC